MRIFVRPFKRWFASNLQESVSFVLGETKRPLRSLANAIEADDPESIAGKIINAVLNETIDVLDEVEDESAQRLQRWIG